MATKTRREQLEEMLTDFPNDAFLRYGLAMDYASAGDDAGAVVKFQELFAADPSYVPAYMQAGLVLTRLNRIDEARDVFRRGIATAQRVGDMHAMQEMQGFLDGLE